MGLETFLPDPKRIEIRGKSIEILPVRMRELPEFARGMAPAATLLAAGNLLQAVSVFGDDIRNAVSVAARLEKDWVADLYPNEFMPLFEAVVEVNADFFANSVLPETTRSAERLKEKLTALNGKSSSPGSSNADIDTERSST